MTNPRPQVPLDEAPKGAESFTRDELESLLNLVQAHWPSQMLGGGSGELVAHWRRMETKLLSLRAALAGGPDQNDEDYGTSGPGACGPSPDVARLPSFLHFDGMTWPDPTDPNEVQRRLRYGQPTRQDHMFAASVMEAYAQLVRLPQRTRNARGTGIRAALAAKAAGTVDVAGGEVRNRPCVGLCQRPRECRAPAGGPCLMVSVVREGDRQETKGENDGE